MPPDATGPNEIDPRLLYRDTAEPDDVGGGLQGINPDDFPGWAGGTITLENFDEFIEYLIGRGGFASEREDHPANLSIEEIYAALQAILSQFSGGSFFISNMIMFLYYIGGPEGFSGTVYTDSEGNKTIGYGFTQNRWSQAALAITSIVSMEQTIQLQDYLVVHKVSLEDTPVSSLH